MGAGTQTPRQGESACWFWLPFTGDTLGSGRVDILSTATNYCYPGEEVLLGQWRQVQEADREGSLVSSIAPYWQRLEGAIAKEK